MCLSTNLSLKLATYRVTVFQIALMPRVSDLRCSILYFSGETYFFTVRSLTTHYSLRVLTIFGSIGENHFQDDNN